MTTIGDIFKIPEAVHQGDFVLRLTEGLKADHRQQTLAQYVVTPQLVQAFDQALSLIGSAIQSNASKAAYLHGSFGSGKSHFMAVLDMILEGDSAARAMPELAASIRKANAWWDGGRYLVVPYHMIGAESMEQKILGGYAAWVRDKHPTAPTPGFYRSEGLLADAENLRAAMGDTAFFQKLSERAAGNDGWGNLGGAWDSESYAAAVEAGPENADHQRLAGDLVDAYFQSLQRDATPGQFIDLDRGLAVMSQHAHALGYRAVVLFLDELILWLASHSQDQAFLSREGQKVAKLVEAQHADRPIPIVSFIARQRDLRELVGKSVPGAEQLAFDDVLRWWEARFDKIVLEDRNLPAIVERRLLRPKGPREKEQLHAAFERTARVRQEVLDILLTRDGDKQMFEQVYPFSPALVQVLVAISGMLQRERTALKLMLQLLVHNRDTLELGDVIAVGNLFDVILAGDEEPFTPAIKHAFERAREVWSRKLAPLLEEAYGVSEDEVRSGSADAAVTRRYLADAGLLKTLLLAALVPDVEALHNLTPLKLAALNHGTVRSPLPNGEASAVLGKVRGWAARAGEIQVGSDSANPSISLQLSGVDVEGVLENARGIDNYGNRVRTVKQLLFRDIGIDPEKAGLLTPEYPWRWRGTPYRAEILVQNVRECSDESLRPGDGAWRVVIDYPFDNDPERGPSDDRAHLRGFLDKGGNEHTMVWLPSFLTDSALADLGRLGTLNHVLSGQRLDEYAAHLAPAERAEARAILKNQRDQLEQRVTSALKQVYGIAQGAMSDVHTTLALDDHFQSLAGGLALQPPPGGSFKDSLEHLLGQALTFEFPGHPRFEGEVRRAALKWALEVLRTAADAPDRRAGMERSQRDEIRRVVEPLKLAQCGEAHLVLEEYWRSHFTRKLATAGVANPTVAQLRKWIDEPDAMGLPDDVADLVILGWAAQAGRTPWLHGAPMPGEIGSLNREAELREQPLPEEPAWREAVRRASDIFGEAGTGAGRNPGNVASLSQKLREHAAAKKPAVDGYRDALQQRIAKWGIAVDGARTRTAIACGDLLAALVDADTDAIQALVDARIETSLAAMGTIMAHAQALTTALKSPAWETLDAFRGMGRTDAPAVAVASSINEALANDEHVTALATQLDAEQRAALRLMAPVPAAPPPSTPPPGPIARSIARQGAQLGEVRAVMREVEDALGKDATLRVDIDCRLYPTKCAGGTGE